MTARVDLDTQDEFGVMGAASLVDDVYASSTR
jgi:hypothetical protein